MKLKSLVSCAVMAGAITSAQAIEMTLSGSTAGSFNNAAFSSPASLGGLTFNGALSFSETTVGNFAGLVLGNFSLANTPFDYAGDTFRVQFTFTAPSGILPGGPAIFTANMIGAVNGNGEGGVGIAFGNPQAFTFSSPNGGGSFILDVDDLNVQPGASMVSLTGSVRGGSQGTSVPDGGSSVAMLGMGLIGLAALGRKNKKVG